MSADASTAPRHDRRRFDWGGYGLISPALVVTTAIFGVAMVILALYSFRGFEEGQLQSGYTTATWVDTLTSSFFWSQVWTTVKVAVLTVLLTAALGYPMAFALHRLSHRALRYAALFVIFSPLMTSVVVRSYGWSLILGDGGFVNDLLLRAGLVDEPVKLLYEFSGVVIGLVHILLPFMIFPIVAVLDQLDPVLEESAADLGATGWITFTRVIFPLTIEGLIAGSQLVFALAISAFATPALLGGGRVDVLAADVYGDVGNLDWPHAATSSFVLLVLALAGLALFTALLRARSGARQGAAA